MRIRERGSRLAEELPRWGLPLLLVALPVLWLWKLVFAGRVLYWGVPLQQFAQWRGLVLQSWLAGTPPLWNPWLGAGTPLLANHQSASLYPFNLLDFLFPIEHALGYSVLLHLGLAAVGMYFYAKELGLTRPARACSALAYAFGGYPIGRLQFLTMIAALAWLPFIMWAAHRLARQPTWRRTIALGLLLALQFLAGHAQLWYYTLWLTSAYTLYQAGTSEVPGRPRLLIRLARTAAALGLAVVLAALLAAPQMWPTAELALQSQRSGGAAWDFAMTYSFWPWRLITLVVPNFFGNPGHGDYWGYATYWEDAAYIGLLPLILALYAAWHELKKILPRRHREHGELPVPNPKPKTQNPKSRAFFFSITIPLTLLLAMGRNLPLYPLIFRFVPGFGLFQAPARLLIWYAFAASALAGIGWDLLGRGAAGRLERLAKLGLVATIGVILAAGVGTVTLPQVQQTFTGALLATGVLALPVLLLLLWRARSPSGVLDLHEAAPRSSHLWSWVALGLVVGDLFLFSVPLVPTAEAAIYHQPTATARWLAQDQTPFRIYTFAKSEYTIRYERYLRFQDFGPADLTFLMGLREAQLPNLSPLEGIATAGNFDPLLIGRYAQFMQRVNAAPPEEALRLLGLLNVRYVLEPGKLGDLAPLYTGDGITIYRNPHVLPRSWVTPYGRVVADSEALLQALAQPAFDPRREVLLEAPLPLPAEPATWSSSADPVLHYGPSGVTIDVTLDKPGYLCVSETDYPGWQAQVDSRPAPMGRADYLLKAIPLSAGPHRVELSYQPMSFLAGSVIGLVCWSGCALALAVDWWRRRTTLVEGKKAS